MWVALTWEGHVHHTIARAWFESLALEDRIGFCRFTQISLLRLLTTQSVMGEDVMTQVQAWGAYGRWLQDSRILFLQEPASVESTFQALSKQPGAASKTWADAYLAAFAQVEGMRLVTFDRAFDRRLQHVLILKPQA